MASRSPTVLRVAAAVVGLVSWLGVGYLFVEVIQGGIDLAFWVAGQGPIGVLGAVLVGLATVVAGLVLVFNLLWYLTAVGKARRALAAHAREGWAPLAAGVLLGLIVVAAVAVAGISLDGWQSGWRWAVILPLAAVAAAYAWSRQRQMADEDRGHPGPA